MYGLKACLLLFLLSVARGYCQPATPDPTLAAKVQTVVDAYAASWNAADMDAMAKLYTPDVHWVNIVGMHWQGFQQVDAAHKSYFETMFRGVQIALEAVESVRPLPGGGAVAVVRWKVGEYRMLSGQTSPPSRNRTTLVLVPDGEQYKIAHGANILIVEQAQQFDHVRNLRKL